MEADTQELDNEEELLKRHRQERKDLQAKIQALKKTSTKGKKKKEMQETITQMEQELELKQNEELSQINNISENKCSENVEKEDMFEETEANDSDADNVKSPLPMRMTRAQKRRNKKAEETKERDKRIADEEKKNKDGDTPRDYEIRKIKDLLKEMGFELYNIPADGNCLYCAVNHQLKVTGRNVSTVNNLRKETASFMRDNIDNFLPFMYNSDESDEPMDEAKFLEYCKNVETTKLWGSQLELRALSSILQCPIKIIQATGLPTIQGENYEGPPLVLTYHRHLYRLGEHYNSTIEVKGD